MPADIRQMLIEQVALVSDLDHPLSGDHDAKKEQVSDFIDKSMKAT